MFRRSLWMLLLLTHCARSTPTDAPPTKKIKQTIIAELQQYLTTPVDSRAPLAAQGFATAALSRDEAQTASGLLFEDARAQRKALLDKEFTARALVIGELRMPFWYKTFGERPASGHSLYISLHGGGGAPAEVNDSQWENQKTLYQPKEGIYLCPRAPGNTWDLWHQGHIDGFFARLIEAMILFEGVDPDRVYLMGYSAGGDGVYQVAPRMADYFAAASMMAGHPNEASPLGLRNLPFAIHVGELDAPYNRNKVAKEWGDKLAALRAQDAKGYRHVAELHKERGHWMNLEDAVAVEWMAQFTREAFPTKVVWYQDDVTHQRFYWLLAKEPKAGDEVRAFVEGQTITIELSSSKKITLLLSDELLSLDEPVVVMYQGRELFRGTPERQMTTITAALDDRLDLTSVYTATITLTLE